MKPYLAPFLALAFASLAALPAWAQTAPGKKTAEAAPFKITTTKGESPDVVRAARELEQARAMKPDGAIASKILGNAVIQLEDAERRAPYLITIRSAGGPLRAFLDAAADLKGVSFTLINAGEPADLETPLPPFELKNATWGTVIGVLETFLNLRGLALRHVGGDHPDPSVAKSVVCMLRPVAPKESSAGKPDFDSFQLGDYLWDQQNLDSVVEAIRAGWELDPAHDPAALRLKFHPPTRILLVSGPAPAATVARQVISNLNKKPVLR